MRSMWKKIFNTISTRYAIAILNLLLIVVNAKVLGAEGVGLIGLIIASINLSVVVCSLLCGNTIVYFLPRVPLRLILIPAYLWAFIGAFFASIGLWLTGMMPKDYSFVVFSLAALQALVATNARYLLGINSIKAFNLTFFLQGGLLCPLLLFFYYLLKWQNVEAYILSLFIANTCAWIGSSLFAWRAAKHIKPIHSSRSPLSLISEIFRYGLWASADNLAETFTTRINYFLLQRQIGLSAVGLLDAGTRISESVWHISRSISFIAYGEVARSDEVPQQRKVTKQLLGFTFILLTLVMAGIAALPEALFTHYLLNQSFIGIRPIIWALSPGIIALGTNSILSHYFIGTGRVKISALCSFIGLFSITVVGFYFIPLYGTLGAALSSSIAFCTMFLFSLFVFSFEHKNKANKIS